MEADIQKSILIALQVSRIGYFWRNNNVGVFDKAKNIYRKPSSQFAPKGVSDILGVHKGKFVAIEVKSEKQFAYVERLIERTSERGIRLYLPKSKNEVHLIEQIVFLENIKKQGGIGFFTYSVTHALAKLREL